MTEIYTGSYMYMYLKLNYVFVQSYDKLDNEQRST